MDSLSLRGWRKGKRRNTRVDWVSLMDDETRVRQLLVRNPSLVKDNDVYNIAPLHHACFHGWLKVAKCLIEFGADVDAQDRWGNTPLCWALGAKKADPDEIYQSKKIRAAIIELLKLHGALKGICK